MDVGAMRGDSSFELRMLYKERGLLQELVDALTDVVDSDQIRPESAERVLRVCYMIAGVTDSDSVARFALSTMRDFLVVDGIDEDFWNAVYDAGMMEYTVLRLHPSKNSSRGGERELHKYLEQNWAQFFGPSLRMVKREHRIAHGRADFLAEDAAGLVVIECKTGAINLKALNQIQNYMYNSGVQRGILIGAECRVLLPDEITFMPHNGVLCPENLESEGGDDLDGHSD